MKKISAILVTLCALVGFSACEDEKKPVFHEASSESFEVYQPALADQYYELTEKGSIEIICKSAPNYGAPMGPTKYGAMVSLSQDFSNAVEITAENNASKVLLKESDLAIAICKLMGLTKDDAGYEFTSTMPVYLKAVCQIEAIGAASRVESKNFCVLNKVMPYFAIPTPGFIYLVGAPEGWAGPTASNAEHYEEWKLFEKDDEIGSQVYYGTFEIPQGQALFRFYTSLTNWDTDSWGSQSADNPIDFELGDGNTFTGPMVAGKGAFQFPGWPGGPMAIKVSMAGTPTLEIAPAQ